MSSSNCCFLSCIQISQEAGNVAWYSPLIKNIPQFVVIKDFTIVNEAEVGIFLKFPCLFYDAAYVGNLISGSSAFSKNPAWTSRSSWFTYCWSLAWENFEHSFASVWDKCNCMVIWTFFGMAFLWNWNENGLFPSPVATDEFSNLLVPYVECYAEKMFK